VAYHFIMYLAIRTRRAFSPKTSWSKRSSQRLHFQEAHGFESIF
jgi:hypothetical protein